MAEDATNIAATRLLSQGLISDSLKEASDMTDLLKDDFALINDEMSMGHTYSNVNQFHGAHRNFTDLGLRFNPETHDLTMAEYPELQVFKILRRIDLSISLDESAYGNKFANNTTKVSSISAI